MYEFLDTVALESQCIETCLGSAQIDSVSDSAITLTTFPQQPGSNATCVGPKPKLWNPSKCLNVEGASDWGFQSLIGDGANAVFLFSEMNCVGNNRSYPGGCFPTAQGGILLSQMDQMAMYFTNTPEYSPCLSPTQYDFSKVFDIDPVTAIFQGPFIFYGSSGDQTGFNKILRREPQSKK